MRQPKFVKRSDQVIISNTAIRREKDFLLGSAECPHCGAQNDAVMRNDVRRGFGTLCPVKRCDHAVMAVDAGRGDIAIHFVWTVERKKVGAQ